MKNFILKLLYDDVNHIIRMQQDGQEKANISRTQEKREEAKKDSAIKDIESRANVLINSSRKYRDKDADIEDEDTDDEGLQQTEENSKHAESLVISARNIMNECRVIMTHETYGVYRALDEMIKQVCYYYVASDWTTQQMYRSEEVEFVPQIQTQIDEPFHDLRFGDRTQKRAKNAQEIKGNFKRSRQALKRKAATLKAITCEESTTYRREFWAL
jgi:hypothetical protein